MLHSDEKESILMSYVRESTSFKLCKNIHIDSSELLKVFGWLCGCAYYCLRNKAYSKLKTDWEQYDSAQYSWWDYLGNRMIYGVLPEEYVCYNFAELNDKGKREFITEQSRREIYNKCVCEKDSYIFENKFETYNYYKRFYKRDCLLLNETTTFEDLAGFVKKHKQFIYKPLRLWLGKNIEIINVNEDNLQDLRNHLLKKGEGIIEELIEQSECTGRFHPESVNTVRIPAFNTRGG